MTTGATAGWVPDRAEIVFIQHSPAAGKEMPDWHPLLVASTRAFNEKTGFVMGFAMTHSEMHADNPFALAVKTGVAVSYVVANQFKSFDWKARGAKPHNLGGGHHALLTEALAILDDICAISEASNGK